MKYGNYSNSSIRWSAEEESQIFGEADKGLLQRFKTFHEKNGFVYSKFFDKANQIMNTGRKKYSAWTIISVIRWEQDYQTRGDNFLINNDFIALYARLLIYHHPVFKDLFELRSMKPNRKMSQEQLDRMDRTVGGENEDIGA